MGLIEGTKARIQGRMRSEKSVQAAPKLDKKKFNLPGEDICERGLRSFFSNSFDSVVPTQKALKRSVFPIFVKTMPASPIPWEMAGVVEKSTLGMNSGVFLVDIGKSSLALKTSKSMSNEIFASRLGEVLGLRTPAMRVHDNLPAELRRKIGATAREHKHVMVMTKISGLTFKEATLDDKAMVFKVDAQGGYPVLRDMGRVIAFDLLIKNGDRFSFVAEGTDNQGNLMFSEEGLHVIDSTLPPIYSVNAFASHTRDVEKLLALTKDDKDQTANRILSQLTRFFPAEWNVKWKLIQADVVAGFVEQARNIATLDDNLLKAVFAEAEKAGKMDKDIKKAIFSFRDLFVAAKN